MLFVKISAILTANIKIDNGRMRHDANMPRYLRRFSSSKGEGAFRAYNLVDGRFFFNSFYEWICGLIQG